jgi:hypothetical protein
MAGNFHQTRVPLPALGGSAFALQAPSAQLGGALTVIDFVVENQGTTSGTGTFSVALVKLSNAGTPANLGTVATLGGTAASGDQSHWTAFVPKRPAAGTAYSLDAGQTFQLEATAITNGTVTGNPVALLTWVPGK